MEKIPTRIAAQEGALVDAQCLIQKALNEKYGNPRDCEEEDPSKTKELFNTQYENLADLLEKSAFFVHRLLSDQSRMSVKDLAGVLNVLGYELKLDIVKIAD